MVVPFQRTPLNTNYLHFECISGLNQIISTRRQSKFDILRENLSKIGMNTTVNKLHPFNKLIDLDELWLCPLQKNYED